ncbi:MAG: hypothetical protein QOJ18_1272, partial [Microbacteriaceae bacterium]|nr:hypothetical protein [Microbacteriaceae bacterium]
MQSNSSADGWASRLGMLAVM